MTRPGQTSNLLARQAGAAAVGYGAAAAVGAFILVHLGLGDPHMLFTMAEAVIGFLGLRALVAGVVEWLIKGRVLRGGTAEPGLVHLGADNRIALNASVEVASPLRRALAYVLGYPLLGLLLAPTWLHETYHLAFSSELVVYGLEGLTVLTLSGRIPRAGLGRGGGRGHGGNLHGARAAGRDWCGDDVGGRSGGADVQHCGKAGTPASAPC